MQASEGLVIVGGGLAGCEAAWQVARRGVHVTLYEMKPARFSPAHHSPDFAELVCSNSLRSDAPTNAVGLLKEEMRRLSSLILQAADENAVPSGKALAVDRARFARSVTEAIESHPRIEVRREPVLEIPEQGRVIIATGPLTLSPIVYADSIDCDVAFRASRYDDGPGDYLNIPLDEASYRAFVEALIGAETVPLHPFEAALYFEGCLPIEEMARRGARTLAFGPMKPVGLVDPRTGERPHAVIQLRQEDKPGVLYNLVGFQTKLRIGEQQRIFRGLPALSGAVFARYGSVHRNTYVNAPKRLSPTLEVKARPGLYLTGQMAGVEGYVESAALGLLAGINAASAARGVAPVAPPEATAHGALLNYLVSADPRSFQPMNVNFGLFPPLAGVSRKLRKREKNERMTARALEAISVYAAAVSALLE
jgi:methylenetetrahydrofolate--tRNA-(uracil-5-)-methyltransferase